MIYRETYLSKIEETINKPIIKIITGIRRSGRSSVMLMLREKLISRKISEKQIIYINFESFNNTDLLTARALHKKVAALATGGERLYLLFDEIQEVEQWEKAINAILVDFDTDIYLTGSNSHLLSSELATYLAGRYIEIPVYTLSFSEYIEFISYYKNHENESMKDTFIDYLRMGGFPLLHTGSYNNEIAYKIIYDIYSSVILRDTIQRFKIRDIELLERIVKFVFNNIGNTFSGKNVADYFKSQQRRLDINTVYNYLQALESAFIIYRTSRYDINGKEILKTQEKYYLSDVGLLYATMGYKDTMIAGILENIVYLELRRRGYKVMIGKQKNSEADFVAERSGERIYVQVAYKLENKDTIDREFNSLLSIKDQYPKYVVTMDDFWKESIEGVQHCYISDFLLMEGY